MHLLSLWCKVGSEQIKYTIGRCCDRAGTRMVIESCRDWSRTYELPEDLVEDIILAHPLKVKAIASAKIKTDAIDWRTLMRLLMANLT